VSLYALPSILKRIDLRQVFPCDQPLEVELGSGDGSFLAECASRHPSRNFLGTERLLGRARKLDRKSRKAGLTNLAVIQIESSYFLEFLLPHNCAEAIHVYFPDPWPKRRHWRHRLINERFPQLAAASLRPGGCVYLRTDNADYFSQIRQVFAAARMFAEIETPAELARITTDFEREFNARGIPTLRYACRKRTEPLAFPLALPPGSA